MAKYSNIDLSKYNKGYQASSTVNDAWRKKQEAENAVSDYGDFNYSNQGAYQSVINDILNRKDFSYDMNADGLYQQYKNQYTALGELAMQDTVGQVAALTGGYGNSYAATAGSQAYQSYLNQLNDKIPELWSLARSAYESDRAADYDKYGMLSADRQTQYGEWTDGLNRLLNERGYYSDNYNNAYNQDYSKWADGRSYDQTQYWNEYNAGYQAERDAVADKQFDDQLAFNKEQANKSGSPTYAITDYAKVTDAMRKNIEAVRESAYPGRSANMPIQMYARKNPEVFNEKTAAYLDSLVADGKISPAVADLLMDEYAVK